MTTAEMIEVLQAHKRGETIECKNKCINAQWGESPDG